MIASPPQLPCIPIPYQKPPQGPKLHGAQKKISYIYAQHTSDDLEKVYHVGGFPTRPSNLFLRMYSDVLHCVENKREANIAAHELIATSGVIPLTINAPFSTLFMHYRDTIIKAESEILIAAGFWKPGKAVDIISGALRELNSIIAARGGPKVVVKILWGRGLLKYQKKNTEKEQVKLKLPSPAEAPYLEIESMNVHKALFGVFHVKFMIVDRKILLLTSANMQDKKNVEFVVHMEGRVVDSFYDVFKKQWHRDFVPPLPLFNGQAPPRSGTIVSQDPVRGPCIFHSEHPPVPMFLANRLPGASIGHHTWDAPQNIAWLSAMHHAQRNIFIETPDFNATFAIDAVISACQRGVSVTISVSWVYNALKEKIFFQGGTNQHVMKKLYKRLTKLGCQKNLTVCFYVDREQTNPTKVHANHTKFMAIDDEVAIFGSGNMDTQSWHHSQEVNIVVASPMLVKEWMDLFKVSQNTHLYGVIDPNLPFTPKEQMAKLLSKQNTQPKPKSQSAPTTPRVLNNSDYIVRSDDTYVIDGKHCNNFNAYYNTFKGFYSSPEGEHNTNTNINNQTSILNSEFFSPQAPDSPSLPSSSQPQAPPLSSSSQIQAPLSLSPSQLRAKLPSGSGSESEKDQFFTPISSPFVQAH